MLSICEFYLIELFLLAVLIILPVGNTFLHSCLVCASWASVALPPPTHSRSGFICFNLFSRKINAPNHLSALIGSVSLLQF